MERKRGLKPLDYLLIPTGFNIQRRKRTFEELKKREIKNILILNGLDSEEDILYLGKKLKKGDRIGFVTFPLHYLEYKELINKAKKDGNFPKGIKTENITTRQTIKQFIYGILGLLEERIDKKVNYVKEEHESWIIKKIKEFIKKILSK